MARAYALWLNRLRSGRLGEHPDRQRTWVFDNLWRAACFERNADDARRAGLYSIAEDWQRKCDQTLQETNP